jgi:hypothetical protein
MIDSYQALVNRLTDAISNSEIANIDLTDVAYENMDYDPSGKDAWLSVYYMPASIDSLAKDRFDEENGLFQIAAYVPLNDRTGNTPRGALRLIQLTDDIQNIFYNNATASANGETVYIQDSTLTPSASSESWMSKTITINYVRN